MMEWFESAALHAISPGDSTLKAPGACMIAPKVEPLSEDLKYKLLNVYLHAINVDLFSNTSHLLLKVRSRLLHTLNSCLVCVHGVCIVLYICYVYICMHAYVAYAV